MYLIISNYFNLYLKPKHFSMLITPFKEKKNQKVLLLQIQVGCQGEVLYYESGEVLEQAAQRGCGCPVPGGVQGQVRWSLGQPGLVLDMEVGLPAAGRLEIHDP